MDGGPGERHRVSGSLHHCTGRRAALEATRRKRARPGAVRYCKRRRACPVRVDKTSLAVLSEGKPLTLSSHLVARPDSFGRTRTHSQGQPSDSCSRAGSRASSRPRSAEPTARALGSRRAAGGGGEGAIISCRFAIILQVAESRLSWHRRSESRLAGQTRSGSSLPPHGIAYYPR